MSRSRLSKVPVLQSLLFSFSFSRLRTNSHSVVVNSECASARSQQRVWLCGVKWELRTALPWRRHSVALTLVTCK